MKRWKNKSGKRWEIKKGGESKSGKRWEIEKVGKVKVGIYDLLQDKHGRWSAIF